MEALELTAEERHTTGPQVKRLRQAGLVPAVLYGKGLETISLQINARPLQKVLREAGTHQLIALQVGNRRPIMTLARDIQRDVIKHDYLHVDFYAVKMDEKVSAEVPLVFEGVSPAVRDKGGILTHGLDVVEIECLPSDLVSSIMVNIESLIDFHDTITVADLQVPGTVTILSDLESMVAKVEPPRKVEELEALEEGAVEAVGAAEPEVLTKAKEKEEEKEKEQEAE